MDNEMDNNTETDLVTGESQPYMYLGEDAEGGLTINDTVNIPIGEYEELIDDSMFLAFLRETVGEEVWANAEAAYDDYLEEQEDEADGGTAL